MATEISKVIFQVETDSKPVVAALDEIGRKYRQTSAAVKDQNQEIKALQDKELGLLEIRKKTTNPSSIVQLTKAIEKNRQEIVKLTASQDSLNKETKEYKTELTGLPEKLNSAFNKQVVASFEKQVSLVTEEQKKLNKTISDPKPMESIRGLTQEYRRLVSEAIRAGESTDIGLNFLKQAGQVKDRIADIQQITKNFGSDTAVFDGLIGATQGIAASFQVAQGAAALFGEENDDVQKALLKVNAAMAIANGLQQIQTVLQKESAFRVFITTGAMRAFKLVVGESSTALKVFKLALAASGIGLAVIGIQKLVENWEKLRLSIFNTLLTFGSMGQTLAFSVAKVDKALNEVDDSVQRRIDRANEELHNIERNSTREIELARAKNKAVEEIAALQNKKVLLQQKEIAKIQGFLLVNQGKLTSEQLKALADFGQDFADAKNQEFILEAESVQRIIEERKKIAEADKKLVQGIEDIEIALVRDERERHVREINIQAQRRTDELLETKASKEKIAQATIAIEKERIRKIEELEDRHIQRSITQDEAEIERRKKRLEIRTDVPELFDPEAEERFKRLEDQRRRERLEKDIEAINVITQATIQAAETVISVEIKKQDALFEIQSKRVQQAAAIADRGNAELLQQEQERLDAIQKKREQFVRAQQILQQVEIVGNSIVAVSKAAAQGGVAAPATIAATIAALIAGFALVRTITQPEGFQEGGYTGDGDPSEVSTARGNRGYKYHKKEFIFNEDLTKKNLPTFRKIHAGELDLNSMAQKASLFDQLPMPLLNNLLLGHAMQSAQNSVDTSRLESLMSRVDKTIKEKPTAIFNINENGFKKYWEQMIYNDQRIKNKAS